MKLALKAVLVSFSILFSSCLLAAPITSFSDSSLIGADLINFDNYDDGYISSGAYQHKDDIVNFNLDHIYGNNYSVGDAYSYTGQSGKNIILYDKANFSFDETVSAFAFSLAAINAPWTIEAYDITGTLIESQTITTSCCGGSVYGIAASGIAEINMFFTETSSSWYDAILLDHFTYKKEPSMQVPEPSIFTLMILGLAGVFFQRKRK